MCARAYDPQSGSWPILNTIPLILQCKHCINILFLHFCGQDQLYAKVGWSDPRYQTIKNYLLNLDAMWLKFLIQEFVLKLNYWKEKNTVKNSNDLFDTSAWFPPPFFGPIRSSHCCQVCVLWGQDTGWLEFRKEQEGWLRARGCANEHCMRKKRSQFNPRGAGRG